MHSNLLQNALWISGPLLQCVVALIMIHRGTVKRFPVFWSYTVFHVLLAPLSFWASRTSYRTYFYVYWGTEVVDMFVTLLVLQELFSNVFSEYDSIRTIGRVLFRSTVLIMILVSLAMARLGTAGSAVSSLVQSFVTLERSVHIFEIGVLFMLFLACRTLGLVWQRFWFGIAAGFGLMLAGEAIAATLRSSLGATANYLYTWLEPSSCVLATVVWSYYAVTADRQVVSASTAPEPTQLAEWNHALEQLLSRS